MISRFAPLIVAAICVVLQVVVSPVIVIFSCVPSFILPLVLVMAILRPADSNYLFAFVMGLIADLLSQTPLGLTPLLLLIASLVLSYAFQALDKSTVSMPAIALVVSLAVILVLQMIVMLVLGYNASPVDLFLQSVLPGIIADSVIGVLLYLIISRLGIVSTSTSSDAWAPTVGNTRFR